VSRRSQSAGHEHTPRCDARRPYRRRAPSLSVALWRLAEPACRGATDCDARRHEDPRNRCAAIHPRVFRPRVRVAGINSDVWCRVTDVAASRPIDARGAGASERREISGVRSPEVATRYAGSHGRPTTRTRRTRRATPTQIHRATKHGQTHKRPQTRYVQSKVDRVWPRPESRLPKSMSAIRGRS